MVGRLSLIVLLLSASILKAQAQEASIIDHLAQYNLGWTASHPYLLEYAFLPFYQAGLRHEAGSGSFRSAFQDQRYANMGYHSISQKAIKEWRLQGTFSYRKVLDQEKPYLLQKGSSSHNPFVLADTKIENWGGDQIDFSVSGLSPIYMKRFRSYASIRYGVSSGNRNAEPRPLYRHSDLLVEIGKQVSLTENFRFGIGGSFGQMLEENRVGGFAVQDFSMYQLRGISTFTRNTFQSSQRNQKENTFAGKAFVSYSKKQDWGFVEISSSTGRYEARDGVAFPLEAGSVESRTRKISTAYNKLLSGGKTWQSAASLARDNSFATDPIFQAINYDFVQNTVNGQSSILFPGNKLRRLAVHLDYLSELREETAGRDKLQFQNLKYQLTSDLVFPVAASHTLWLRPALGHRANLQFAAQNNGTGLVGEIFDLEMDYYSSDALLAQLRARWLAPLKENQLSLTIDLSSEQTTNQHYNRLSLEVGLLF